jgi:hypothetical protein
MSKESSENNPHGKDVVVISINNDDYSIHRGNQKVLDIKALGKIHPSDILNVIVDNKLIPLDNDGSFTIKGGEKFSSHPQDSISS